MNKHRHELFIAGGWQSGAGSDMQSVNPATNEVIWRGNGATMVQIDKAFKAARTVSPMWRSLSVPERSEYLGRFNKQLTDRQTELAEVLALETGKPLWEAKTEITAMIGKLEASKQAYADRCKELVKDMQGAYSVTRHKAHGVILVLGPFNFPGHLPNGHIIPALLAGNTIVFKPSELTPLISVKIMECWKAADLPSGVINMVLGDAEVGQALVNHPQVDGVFFTGSFNTGFNIQQVSMDYPQRILALEMGGNNPLVVYKPKNIDAAVYHTIQSAFITAGQRCSCARRLIVVHDHIGEDFVRRLVEVTTKLKVGAYTDKPEPFLGPVISNSAAEKILDAYHAWVYAGAKELVPMRRLKPDLPLLSPAILDVTKVDKRSDEEVFGPLLRLTWVSDFSRALIEANNTSYGLTASLLGANRNLFNEFLQDIRAGIINWNRPTVGASSAAPFGGVGRSGNYRPSAYYAADYCAYPVASLEEPELTLPSTVSPGIIL